MRANEAARTTGRKPAGGRLASGDVAGAPRVLAAVWCRSVGTTWTLELHELDGDPARCNGLIASVAQG